MSSRHTTRQSAFVTKQSRNDHHTLSITRILRMYLLVLRSMITYVQASISPMIILNERTIDENLLVAIDGFFYTNRAGDHQAAHTLTSSQRILRRCGHVSAAHTPRSLKQVP